MRTLRNKSKISTLALVLWLTITALFAALPAVNAQPPRQTTNAFIGAVPNPVGKGQTVLLHVGDFTATAGKDYGWENLTITVTKPDNTTETLGPYTTDSTGGTGDVYVPDQTGTYYLQSHFPEQAAPTTWFDVERGVLVLEGTIFEASDSDVLELVVQEEPIEYYPGVPLPTEYWSRPIDSQFREWYRVSGNWLAAPPNLFASYNEDAPETAHILWAKPIDTGGLAGGFLGEHGYYIGDAYEGKWPTSVIINGIIYYNEFSSFTYDGDFYGPTFYERPGVHAVDLRTGEEIWYNPDIRVAFGQTYYYDSFNQHGVSSYLWETIGSTWNAYDPFTGNWLYTIENAPAGLTGLFAGIWMFGPDGEILVPTVDTSNGWMALWDSSAIPELLGGATGAATGMWRPWGRTVNGTHGYLWNVTIPSLPGSMVAVADDRVLGYYLSTTRDQFTAWALSLKPGHEGELLFNETWTPPAEWVDGQFVIFFSGSTSHGEDGFFGLFCKELRKHYFFDFDNGNFLGETDSEIYLDAYGWGKAEHEWLYAYDKCYSVGVGGILYCYDLNNGETLWDYPVEDPYQEYLFSNYWGQRIVFITDGKVYMGHAEHSPIDPKPRGGPFVCIDAETGELVWRADGMFRQTFWGGRAVIGDSIIATMDTYDQRIYAIGKGPSATTVSAPQTAVPLGSSAVIEGTVMDVSAGTKDHSVAARFPNGVPAVADEDMSEWMKYVYKNFPHPDGATGVEVTLDAIDSNGGWTHIGRVTSDVSGTFSHMWTPETEGKYTVIATFEGSKAYWASYAETAIGVGPAPPTPLGAEDVQAAVQAEIPTYTAIDLAIIAAVVVAIVIGIVNLWALRKR